MREGALVLVVGPSGAGKDTLIAAARHAFLDDPRFCFPRRIVTRHAMAGLEDHDSLDRDSFLRARESGRFALHWEAHGLCYALPGGVDADVAAGRIVVANASRRVLPEALGKYPEARIVVVTADPDVRARRLASRGRETPDDIEARLRREGEPVPPGVVPTVIDNSGALEAGVAAFLAALLAMA